MDNLTEPRSTAIWSLVDRLFQFGCAIILSSALVAFSKDRLLKLFSPALDREYLLNLLGVLLLIAVVILVFRWICAVLGEMRLLREYFPEQIRPPRSQVYVWTVSASCSAPSAR